MKNIIALIAITLSLSLGACCSTGGNCPFSGKKAAPAAESCCTKTPKTCTKDGGCKAKH
jgi:hypothetical protein